MREETERVRYLYDQTAERYDRSMDTMERLLLSGGRDWVCSQATGDVLEIAVGTGRNLQHYPTGTRLTGIELSSEMLGVARQRARELGLEADLRQGDAQALDFPDGSFDTVVCTLALCTIPDDRKALEEMNRVLRPGGQLLLLEHVGSHNVPVRLVQRLLDPLMVRFQADHLLREPMLHLRGMGFEIEALGRSKLGVVERLRARKLGRE